MAHSSRRIDFWGNDHSGNAIGRFGASEANGMAQIHLRKWQTHRPERERGGREFIHVCLSVRYLPPRGSGGKTRNLPNSSGRRCRLFVRRDHERLHTPRDRGALVLRGTANTLVIGSYGSVLLSCHVEAVRCRISGAGLGCLLAPRFSGGGGGRLRRRRGGFGLGHDGCTRRLGWCIRRLRNGWCRTRLGRWYW